jgi:IclR family pca regulon transcriptional regulator
MAGDVAVPGSGARRSEQVQSLSRGLAIIRAFDRAHASMTLSEVAARTGLARAVARRFLHTLAQEGYVAAEGRHFRLTPRVLDLGFAYLTSLDFWAAAQQVMQEVVARTDEPCAAAVLDGAEIIHVARVAARQMLQVGLHVGSRLPAFCTAMGRVLLAGLGPRELDAFFAQAELRPCTARTVTDPAALRRLLREAETQGYALVDEELELGLRSLAVPIRRRDGTLLAALDISAHASRRNAAEMLGCALPVLRAAAERMAGGLPP